MGNQDPPLKLPTHPWLNHVAVIAGALAALIATPIFVGWLLDLPLLHHPSVITMKTNTALGLLLCGLGLMLLAPSDAGRMRRWLGRFCAAAATLLGVLTFSEHLAGWDLHIDQLFAHEAAGAAATTSPNRMGPPASLSLVLLGAALLVLSRRSPRWPVYQCPTLVTALVALLPIVGYLYGADELYGLARYTGIAWLTAAALLVLSLGVLFARPQEGIGGLVTADNAGSILVRRLLLPSLFLPLALGWLRLEGERHGLHDAPLGTAMLVLVLAVSLTALICYSGLRVGREAAAAQRQKELLGVTLASIGDAVIATDPEGRITFINATAQSLTGWTQAEALGRPLDAVFRIVNHQTRHPAESPVSKILRSGEVVGLANHTVLLARDGREIPIDDSRAPVRAPDGSVHGVVLVFRDFTERQRAEQEREVAIEFLRLVNASTGTRGLIEASVRFFRAQSGCEAVGIRLQDGDDYPYYEACGFAEEFVLLENSLCTRDEAGQVLRDSAGKPVLDCMCGNVISGGFDPSKPFLTPGGSFWTNCTTRLLAGTTGADRQARTRNRCNGQGYESVALIPLRCGEQRLGLLQLNDRRQNMFTPELVASWERLGGYLAVAVAQARTAEALRSSEAQLRTIVENLTEGVVVSDLDGRLLHWNKAALEIHGFSNLDECLRRLPEFADIFELSTTDGAVLSLDQWPLARVLRGEYLTDLEIRVRCIRSDWHRVFRYSGTLVRDTDGRPLMAVVAMSDITQRKQNEHQTRLALSRFELLAQTASDLLATDSPQAVVERLCRRVMEQIDCQFFFNFLMDEQAGRLHLNACAGVPPEESRRIEWLELGTAVCGCVAQAGQRIVAQNILTTPDERTDRVRSYGVQAYACHPLLAGGKVIGTLSFGTKTRTAFTPDELSLMKAVTDQVAAAMERIRLFDQARRQATELAVANQAKDQFIAALSHELRTPLTPVLMISQLLQQDASLPEHVRADMKTVRQNVVLEARLIDDLLDLTRITRGKIQLKQEIVDAHDLLRRAAQTCCDEQFTEKRLQLRWDLADHSAEIWADPARLQQVFWNLVSNAVKFTPAEGAITIRTRIRKGPADRVQGSQEARTSSLNPALLVEIIDTGEGIEPGKLNSIFNPFEQSGWDKSRRFGGLGLGLAIAKAIVDLHGGRITAASEGRGKGSTFSVELHLSAPAEQSNAPAPGSQVLHQQDRNGTPRILLIEDHGPTAKVLQRLMAHWGWHVHWAPNAAAALATPDTGNFDLVVSDLGLPDGNGHDVMEQLHARHGLRGIAVSGFGTDEDIQKSLESGFVLHLTKPINFEELRSAVTSLLPDADPDR